VNQRITDTSHFQDVRHIEFGFPSQVIVDHQPGDVLGLLPTNRDSLVRAFFSHLKDAPPPSTCIERILSSDKDDDRWAHVSLPCSLNDFVTNYLDIGGSPRRYFFQVIRHFTDAQHEQERLDYFISAEGQGDLRWYNDKEYRSYVQVLEDFPFVQLPFSWMLDSIRPIQPRLYSIASCPLTYPKHIHILVAIVDHETPMKRRHIGLASQYFLDHGASDATIHRVFIKKGTMRLPKKESTPMIMVGPGTGLAPFRAMIQHVVARGDQRPMMLFFGCRNEQKDFLYKQELNTYAKQGKLIEFDVAFSRDQPHKIYVQHKIGAHAKTIGNLLLQHNAIIYICGSAQSMPREVCGVIARIIEKMGDIDDGDAYLKRLERIGRLQMETWG